MGEVFDVSDLSDPSNDGRLRGSAEQRAWRVFDALAEVLGRPAWPGGDDPVDELIATILSANTNDTNSGRAFEQLKGAFGGDWDAVRTAPLAAIKEAIRPAGMYNQKAPAIVGTLEQIRAERGGYDLSHLAALPAAEALAYLTQLPGVGSKTASIVILFCFNGAAFPVDTHIQRITQRLGLSGRRASPDKIQRIWESLLPAEVFYPLHINLIRHGRRTCQALQPRCDACPLQDLCDYFQGAGDWQAP